MYLFHKSSFLFFFDFIKIIESLIKIKQTFGIPIHPVVVALALLFCLVHSLSLLPRAYRRNPRQASCFFCVPPLFQFPWKKIISLILKINKN
jgi:hypothetical protein